MSDQYWRGEAPLEPTAHRRPNRVRNLLIVALIAVLAVVGAAIAWFARPGTDSTATTPGASGASSRVSGSTGSAGSGGATASSTSSPVETDPNKPGGTQSAGPAVTPPEGYTPTEGPSAAGGAGRTPGADTAGASGKGEQIDAYHLRVGDCLLDPGSDPTITKVTRVPCSQLHGYEVFGAFQLTDAASFPGTEKSQTDADNGCGDRFTPFIGRPITGSKLSYTFFMPTETTWAKGDRSVTCMVYDPDAFSTGSLKSSNR